MSTADGQNRGQPSPARPGRFEPESRRADRSLRSARSAQVSRLVAKRNAPLAPRSPALTAVLERLVVTPYASYDVDLSHPKPRFLVLESSDPSPAGPASPVVVLNWFAELRARQHQQP